MLLLVQTYPGANDALARHLPFFANSGATETWYITTEDGHCVIPENHISFRIGKDCYIDGSHLPNRLIDTVEVGLASKHDHILVAEYDVLFFKPIRYKEMEHAVASHLAGGPTWGSLAQSYYHNPYLLHREFAEKFIDEARKAIEEGVCYRNPGQASSPESSPDVFFAYVCERLGQKVQADLWVEFSRNSYDLPGDIELAREAYRNGIDVIHGVKTQKELDFILS